MITGIGIPISQRRTPRIVRSVRLLRVCRYKRMRQGLVLSDDFLRRVFDVADRAADLALAFIDLALGLEIAVTGHLPGLFLDGSSCLFQAAFHPLFIHYLTSKHFSARKQNRCELSAVPQQRSSASEEISQVAKWNIRAIHYVNLVQH